MAATTTITSDEARIDELCEQLLSEVDPKAVSATEFLGAQFDAGLAWVHFPEGHGGLGLAPKLQTAVNKALADAGAPSPYYRNPIGYGMGAPTILSHGSEEQKQRYLRPLFTGEEVWCQLFSEPGADSDVAVATKAMRTATSGSSTVRVWTTSPTSPSGACSSPAPTPISPSTRHDLLRDRHGAGRCRGPPAAPDDRRGGVQRGLLHRRPRATPSASTLRVRWRVRSPRS